jgi:regulator of protease activity HflC (stomatin/prohibitin superfamily)
MGQQACLSRACHVHVQVSVQYQVLKERIEDSFYKLTSQADQIRSYVFDVVRSTVPKLNLDDVFVSKEVRHHTSSVTYRPARHWRN